MQHRVKLGIIVSSTRRLFKTEAVTLHVSIAVDYLSNYY
jgi:hypothetical protein